MPHTSDSNYQEGATCSLSPPMCLPTHTLFPPNKHFTYYFSSWCGISLPHSDRPGTCPWPFFLVGLVSGIQHCHWHGLTSTSGWKLKSCFKLLEAEAPWDQNHQKQPSVFHWCREGTCSSQDHPHHPCCCVWRIFLHIYLSWPPEHQMLRVSPSFNNLVP